MISAFDDHIQRIRLMLMYESDVDSMKETIQELDPTVTNEDFFLLVKAAEVLDK